MGFYANLDGGGSGLFTSDGATTTTIALTSGPVFYALFDPSINTAGKLGFVALLEDTVTGGLFTSDGTTTTTIALTSSPTFQNFAEFSINAAGTLGFRAILDAGGVGLFTGDGTTTTQVLKTGDALFGSTVTDVRLSKQAFNDDGQLAFYYELADGRNGIAVANTVPEPGSALLLLLRRRCGTVRPARAQSP